MELPTFKYHSIPLATESITRSDTVCACCGEARGFIYTGPVHSVGDYDDCICPWCIADGSAHEKLKVSFTDKAAVGGWYWLPSGDLPASIVEEIAYRTPGFCGWQEEQRWTHCGDTAEFFGRVGARELNSLGHEAIATIKDNTGLAVGPEWDRFFVALDKDGSPTAYLF